MTKKLFFIVLFFVVVACNQTKHSASNSFKPDYTSGASTIIYKTKKDYSHNVPVLLNADKNKVVKMFNAQDFIKNGEIVYPIELEGGYYLDRIGITPQVAYTDFTISAYTKTMMPITAQMLLQHVIDKDPIVEMYDCGKIDPKNSTEILNKIIKNGDLKNCRRLK